MALSLLVARRLQEDGSVRLALVHQAAELGTSCRPISNTALEKGTFKQHAPAFVNGHVTKLGNEGPHSLRISQFLLDLDRLDEEVLVEARKLQALHEYFSALLLVATLLLHLGVLEPALVRVGLQVGHKLEEELGLLEPRLALRVVCQVKHDAPVDLPWDGENALESLFDDRLEAILFMFFHLAADLFVLVLAVRRLGQVLSQALHALTRLELSGHSV